MIEKQSGFCSRFPVPGRAPYGALPIPDVFRLLVNPSASGTARDGWFRRVGVRCGRRPIIVTSTLGAHAAEMLEGSDTQYIIVLGV